MAAAAAAAAAVLLLAALAIAAAEAPAPAAPRAVGGRTEIKNAGTNKAVLSLGRFAVSEHNRRLRRGGGGGGAADPVQLELAFVGVAAAQEQVVAGVAYYLKVIARAVDRHRPGGGGGGGGMPFDAVVVVRPWVKSKELVSFTPSPK